MSIQTDTLEQIVSWREILSGKHLTNIAMLSMAVWLHASNSMLTATTMPNAVAEVGGLNLISWTFALYLAGSITAGASIGLIVAQRGLRQMMMQAALVYTVGCIVCATAPSMPIILVGRSLQGLGGGGLLALVYVAQDRFFPSHFVPKIVACISAVWMVSAMAGPTIGGAFATWGSWRGAYWVFGLQGLLLVAAIAILLPRGTKDTNANPQRIPYVRLLFLTLSILFISLAGAEFHELRSPLLVLLGCASLAFFVIRDRNADHSRMLPVQVLDTQHRIGSGILATFLLCLGIMSFLVYGPLILIELYGLSPFVAGLIVMLESIAWSIAAILYSNVNPAREGLVIRVGSALVVVGLVAMAIALPLQNVWVLIGVVLISNGGFGMMWGFIIRRVVAAAPDEERDRTSSLVPITQQTAFALGAALCGLIANSLGLAEDSSHELIKSVSFWLFAGFVPVAFAGAFFAQRLARDHSTR
ncbi:MAG: MFS transporter [Pseudomonadota bacterium]